MRIRLSIRIRFIVRLDSDELILHTLTTCFIIIMQVEASYLARMNIYGNLTKMNPVFKQFVEGGVLSAEEQKHLNSIQFLSVYNFATGPNSFSDNAHQVWDHSNNIYVTLLSHFFDIKITVFKGL